MINMDIKEYNRIWYHKNKERIKVKKETNAKLRRKRNTEFLVNYLKTHPCVDCGEKDFLVLEFDHRKNKSDNVSNLMSYSINKILKEIEKCDVRCANCHRRKTVEQLGWYKGFLNK